ncbi:MAG: hypothetical protein GY702_04120 [Desulfobulbaceae bacterium]|nr:hypothetical protein [Desulfobulbaceae bacterium]
MLAVIFEVKPTKVGMEEYLKLATSLTDELFSEYRIRVCSVVRDYIESKRAEAPFDSKSFHT